MSLQIWLPLNEDLCNQGLNPLSIAQVQSGVNLDNTGKLGKCYTNSGTSVNIATPCTFSAKTFSVCAWIRLNTRRNNWCRGFGMSGNGTYFGFGCEHTNGNGLGFHYYKTIDGTNTSIFDSYPVNISTGSWNHFAMCYDGVKYYIYQNGKLIKSGNANRSNIDCNMTTLYLFGGTANYYSQCSLNDIRIYDHCLSPKEVEEIAKGLVLHYKLDRSTNLAPTTYNYSGWTIGSGWTINGNVASFSRTGAIFNNWVRLVPPLQINPNNYPNGITVSMDLLTPDKSAINSQRLGALQIYKSNGSRIGWVEPFWDLTNVVNNKWSRISYTFPQSNLKQISDGVSSASDVSYTMFSFQLVQNGNISIKNIQIENGNKANPYKPADEGVTIYDSSGYSHNGTIVGSLETAIPSPRYSCATKMTNGQYIRVNNRPNTCMPKDAITVNLWLYATSWSNPISCTEGGGWNFENSNGIRFPIYISGVGYKVAQSSITTTSILNAWHMLTGTMDKDNIKIYYDGEEVGTIANGSTNGIGYANNYIFIGAEASGDNTSPANSSYAGNLSDIRIYATALTAEQIKELYNTSMTIDDQGNIHARELVE